METRVTETESGVRTGWTNGATFGKGAEKRREQLLDSLDGALRRVGWRRLSVTRHVTDPCGLSQAMFYAFWKWPEAAVWELVARYERAEAPLPVHLSAIVMLLRVEESLEK
jgi:hypothetical protein